MKMKIYISLLLSVLFISSSTEESLFPTFHSNMNKSEFNNSLLKRYHKYDFVIIYSLNSYWSYDRAYYVFASRKGKWNTFEHKISFADRNKDNIVKHRKHSLEISNKAVDSVFNILNDNHIWNLNPYSLRPHPIRLNDSIMRMPPVSTDGISTHFEFMHGDSTRTLWAYNIDESQKFQPDEAKERFIECRNSIESIINEK